MKYFCGLVPDMKIQRPKIIPIPDQPLHPNSLRNISKRLPYSEGFNELKGMARKLPPYAILDDVYTLEEYSKDKEVLIKTRYLTALPAELLCYPELLEVFKNGKDLVDENRIIPWSSLYQISQKVEFVGIRGVALSITPMDLQKTGQRIEIIPDFNNIRLISNFLHTISAAICKVDEATRVPVMAAEEELKEFYPQNVKFRSFFRRYGPGIRPPIRSQDHDNRGHTVFADMEWNHAFGVGYVELK